jgi:hypothetical protein
VFCEETSNKGTNVLYSANYTMSSFYDKGYTGTAHQAALILIIPKCLSEQHRNLPISKDNFGDRFADQFMLFKDLESQDARQATQNTEDRARVDRDV